jgi:hypothetical protein
VSTLNLDKNVKGTLLHNGIFMVDELVKLKKAGDTNFHSLVTGKSCCATSASFIPYLGQNHR